MSFPGGLRAGQEHGYAALDSEGGLPYESPGTYSQPFTFNAANSSQNVGNAGGGVGGATYPGINNPSRQPAPQRQSISSTYDLTHLPPPPPGPPPSNSYPRPTSRLYDGASTSYSGAPTPPTDGVHFGQTSPQPQNRRESQQTFNTSGTMFPSPGTNADDQPFLFDPMNKLSTSYTFEHIPYEDHTGRQLRHILRNSSLRFIVTIALCGAYIWITLIWQKRGVLGTGRKRMFNAITTAISIALGLNLMSAFKDSALNLRWPVLSAKKRNLIELDLILRADSLLQLSKLALMSKRPVVIISTILWLLLNIAAQGGIAMLNLTYSFEIHTSAVLMTGKSVSVTNMEHFWPQGNNSDPTLRDEEYMAHLYGGLAYNYGINETKYMPKAGDFYQSNNSMLWFNYEESYAQLIFADSSPYIVGGATPIQAYSNRILRIDYSCKANRVITGGDGTSHKIQVENVGNMNISHTRSDSITFFTEESNNCLQSARCSVVQVFEASKTNPWYYNCIVTVGNTVNDPNNRSHITDQMAYVAGSAIAQMGYSDDTGQEAQYYPPNSLWGNPLGGDAARMGQRVATFALGSIAGASLFNPMSTFPGPGPKEGFLLEVRHPKFFYLIIGLLCGCQLLFCIIVAVLANRVMVGPDSHLGMALLLKPIADKLEGVSNGMVNKAYRGAKKNTMVRYEKARNGRWILNTEV